MPFTVETLDRKNGKVGLITMDTIPPNNTLSGALLKELIELLKSTARTVDVMVLCSAHPKFFSNGLDGALLLAADTATRRATILSMIDAAPELYGIEKPWIAEIGGYAMAGGAVIASAADNRYMLSAGGRIGFSELAMGLPLPVCYTRMMHAIVQPTYVRSLLEGTAYKPDEALAMGLLDGIAETPEKLRALTLKRADLMLRLDPEAYLPTRKLYRQTVIDQMLKDIDKDRELASQLVELPVFQRALEAIAGRNRS